MIRRERNSDLINRISNEPSVRAMLSRYEDDGKPYDWSATIHDLLILSNGEDACMVFEPKWYQEWECTTLFAPSCRGKRAVETGLEMRDYMFPHYAKLVFGVVPKEMKRAQWFYRKLGGVEVDSVDCGDRIYTPRDDETMLELRGVS